MSVHHRSTNKVLICVNMKLKSSKKPIKIKCMHTKKAIPPISLQLQYMRCHYVPFGLFCLHLGNLLMTVLYLFLSHLLIAGCNIGVRISVHPSVIQSVNFCHNLFLSNL